MDSSLICPPQNISKKEWLIIKSIITNTFSSSSSSSWHTKSFAMPLLLLGFHINKLSMHYRHKTFGILYAKIIMIIMFMSEKVQKKTKKLGHLDNLRPIFFLFCLC